MKSKVKYLYNSMFAQIENFACFFIEYSKTDFNPITYRRFWPGPLIGLLTITLKRLYLDPQNLVTLCFYLLDTFWQSFSKIDSPEELLQLFLKCLEKLNI